MSSSKYPDNDPRVLETKKHLKLLAKRHTRAITVEDYLEYRTRSAPHLPSVKTLTSMFDSWENLLDQTGIDQATSTKDLSRIPDSVMIAALQQAAEDLGVSSLSSHAYDRWRKEEIAAGKTAPPSSAVIRKWLGLWRDATARAGLEPQQRQNARKPSMIGTINSLAEAKSHIDGMLTEESYQEYLDSLDEQSRINYPTVEHVLENFTNWDMALRAADIEQSDALHPEGLWTAEECRRIAKQSEKVLGEKLTEENYAKIVKASRTPKPSWKVMQDLLNQ